METDVISSMKLLNIEGIIVNCYTPTKGYCFVKFINFITGKDYKEQYLEFIRNEQRRTIIMTRARIQPFCRANNINLGYYDGERVFPRSVTERDTVYIYSIIISLLYGNIIVLVLTKQ